MPSGLLKKVRSSRNLERAWQVIEENARNSKSEEVKKEIKAFSKGSIRNIQSIYRRLVRGKFKFPPSKGVPVFKVDKDGRKNKTKFRPIVIANVESRIVQRAILEVLLQIPELHRYAQTPYSFGGIRKSSQSELAAVPAAIRAVVECIRGGANFVICADISKFFTRISKSFVTEIIATAVKDDEFMNFFQEAIHVELRNMALLREKADAFPIGDIGVAQGNSLSPLLGNIILHDFDLAMNEGDCRCIRYIDDFIILAPTREATRARLRKAETLLAKHGMILAEEKSSKVPISVDASFDFLGIELCNGFIRPSTSAQRKFLNLLNDAAEDSRKGFYGHRSGLPLKKSLSLLATLKRIDGMVQGWGKHYRFCNDIATFQALDGKISKLISSYIGTYSETLERVDADGKRILLGLELLSRIERTPFHWPTREERANLEEEREMSVGGPSLPTNAAA